MRNNQNQIPEEIQWQIFELLEGNLTPEESEKTLKLIQSNSDYQTFYRELSLTYLKPEPSEFPNKSVLLKSSSSTFTIWRNLTLLASSAAAIALLWLNKSETTIPKNHSLPSHASKTITLNQTQPIESIENTSEPVLVKKSKQTSQKKQTPILTKDVVATQITKVDVPINKPFRVIPIIEESSMEFTSPSGEINPDLASNFMEPDVQIIYTDFNRKDSEISESSQTDLLLDIAENLRYGRLPKMKFVPRKRQNHLIPQVDMLVGTDTRFIQTTLIQ